MTHWPALDWGYALLIFLAGFIDSVVGGGGLIAIPTLTMILGPGAEAIATNKILGFSAALMALIIYARQGHLEWKKGVLFLIGISIVTTLGALTSPQIPPYFFKYFILMICPFILWLVLKKDFFVKESKWAKSVHSKYEKKNLKHHLQVIWLTLGLGLLSGFYDGVFGPGGGTFMFLSLFLFGGFGLLQAIATAKLANTFSVGFSLVTYAIQDQVHWKVGLSLMPFIVVGALIGASFATRKAQVMIRPLLATVVILLMIRVAWG